MSSRALWLSAALLTVGSLTGCGFGKADMTCKEYRALGTAADPVAKQSEVVKDHIDTKVPAPKLEISLAHMATIYWCNQRDDDNLFTHDDDDVGDFLDTWK